MHPKILTVDDSKTIRMLLARLFGKYQCQVLEAADGSEGFSVALREKPDLIIIDSNMPVMDGITMLRKLREEADFKNTEVIMLTGDTGTQILASVARLRVSDCVIKPFSEDELLAKAMRVVKLEPRSVEKGQEASSIQSLLNNLHARYKGVNDGELASYIPELTKANPDHFGMCLASVEGTMFQVGDCNVEFTIQSVSKVLVYAHALTMHGRDRIIQRIGIEPSGDAFNSINLDKQNRAFNPMVNAGAITATSFIKGASLEDRRENLLKIFSKAAGRELKIDERVYRSESMTGHRNRALAWLLTNFGQVDEATTLDTLELYYM